MRHHSLFLFLPLGLVLVAGAWLATPATGHSVKSSAPGDNRLFAGTNVVRIRLEISNSDIGSLRKTAFARAESRPKVQATVGEGGLELTNVEVHLKGWCGSFQSVDSDPCFTLRFDKAAPGQWFHGLRKISLNNSVQDGSLLSEEICRELFEAAGVPVARASHAKVQLNRRDLGVYVLTEGMNKQFLKRYFANTRGNLYESHANADVTHPLIVNGGDHPKDDSGLRSLAAALREPNPSTRFQRLEAVLDMDRFLSFMAMEIMTCHWDGYAMNQNNYRLFNDLGTGKIVFIPSGMDQMFGTGGGRSDCPILPELRGVVAQAIIASAEGKRRYLARFSELYAKVFHVDALLRRVDVLAGAIEPVVSESSRLAGLRHRFEVNVLKNRIIDRNKSLERQLAVLQ